MSAPVIPVLGGATVNRKWIYEVNTGSIAAPAWAVVGGLTNSTFNPDAANMVGDTDQAGQGFESSTKTGATWSGTLTCKRAPQGSDATQYDVGQEYLRLRAIGKFGNANRVQIRVSEYDPNDPTALFSPRIEAYTGFVSVQWAPQGGDMLAEDLVQVTLQGQGPCNIIAHPYPATPVVAVIDSIAPTALLAAGGQSVIIRGRGFTGTVVTTGVKFGGNNSPSWTVVSDSEIAAVSPAHAAGAGLAVVVTNAVGPSTTGPTVTYT